MNFHQKWVKYGYVSLQNTDGTSALVWRLN